jgi:hypothetical protein
MVYNQFIFQFDFKDWEVQLNYQNKILHIQETFGLNLSSFSVVLQVGFF